MNSRTCCELACVFAGWLALLAMPQAVCADDSLWTSRPGSYLAQPGDPLDWYQRRAIGYRSALENHWESQRAAQQVSTGDRGHAWFGNHGGYYPDPLVTGQGPVEPIGFTYPAAYGACYGRCPCDPCFDYDCESLELINYRELCGNRSAIDCLEALRHTGRR